MNHDNTTAAATLGATSTQPCVIMVTGPSGGGKSTLLQQLQDSSLANEIAALLPLPHSASPVIEANNLLKRDITTAAYGAALANPQGCILHYDTVFIHSHGLHRYEDDPALAPLSTLARLCIVDVRPAAATLQTQFLTRRAQLASAKSASSNWWANHVRLPLRRLKAALRGRRHPGTIELYRDPTWLATTCYPMWDRYLDNLCTQNRNVNVITVAPHVPATTPPSFRLVAQRNAAPAKHAHTAAT